MPSLSFFAALIFIFSTSLSSASNDTTNNIKSDQDVFEKTSDDYNVCGEVYIDKRFELKSPSYPENYSANLSCHYLLKGPHCPTYYQFKFVNFSIEDSEGCSKDRFVVEDQDVLCGRENKTKSYFARNGSLRLTFKTDEDNSDIGYLIQVSRMPCEKKLKANSTEVMQKNSTVSTVSPQNMMRMPGLGSRMFLPKSNQIKNHCCKTIYKEKKFIITSPGFPYTLNEKADCIFQIQKANDNICRLRFKFLFFWLGYTNQNNCPYGFLEIDGKYICGCNNDITLTSSFKNSDVKTITFKTDRFFQEYATGFLIEVTQDECPKKYSPKNLNSSSDYSISNDEINRVASPNDDENIVEKLELINEKTEILDDTEDDDDNEDKQRNKPKIFKSFYFFVAPEFNRNPLLNWDNEETTYMDINNIKSILTNVDSYRCWDWNKKQYEVVYEDYKNELQCSRSNEISTNDVHKKNCVELNYVTGYFRSPGYPCYYPQNLNLCYRLKKQPGYCSIKVLIDDFNLEDSFKCTKDYFSTGNGMRYCGNSLHKASWVIDLRGKEYEDMVFVTDGYYCDRGFSGMYQQIACQDDFPSPPIDTTTDPVISTTPVHNYCSKTIKEKSFSLEVNEDHEMCTFDIQIFNKDVCKINFQFEKFDLVCAVESLVIDGTMYCGHLTGRFVKVNVNNTPISVVYKSTLQTKYDHVRFSIRGEQVTDDCLFIKDPEAQRLVKFDQKMNKTTQENVMNQTVEELKTNSSMFFVSFNNKNFKDICGIVTNSTTKLPSTFCDILSTTSNVTRCMPLQPKTLQVPYTVKKLGMKLENQNETMSRDIMELDIHEIDCDNFIE